MYMRYIVLDGFNNTIGVSWISRFHALASRRFEKDDIANLFLQFSIPEGFNLET